MPVLFCVSCMFVAFGARFVQYFFDNCISEVKNKLESILLKIYILLGFPSV
jgi:hypothetical protein